MLQNSASRDFASVARSAPVVRPKHQPERTMNRGKEDTGDGFVTVQRKKRRQSTVKNRCGKAPVQADGILRAAAPNTPVYISRLHYTTKAEDISANVRQKIRYTPRVQILESRHNVNFLSFVVRVPHCLARGCGCENVQIKLHRYNETYV